MCGIFAYVGPRTNAADIILQGLKTLEYRGYDSWGVAIHTPNGVKRVRKTGKIGEATVNMPSSSLGIGHTRWATHGGVTESNAHPHISHDGRVVLVHNGIVENFLDLRKQLIDSGLTLQSETDSEVIAELIAQQLQTKNIYEAVMHVFNVLDGMNAITVLDTQSQDIVVVRHGSPIHIGIGDNELFVGSDVTAFLPYTKKVLFLNDKESVHISDGTYQHYHADGKLNKEDSSETIDWEAEDAGKDTYPHHMIKEIEEQLNTIPQTASLNHEGIQTLAEKVRHARRVIITGCGTAHYCAEAAAYMFQNHRKRVEARGAYELMPFLEDVTHEDVVIAISQSGETAETLEVVKKAQEKRAYIAAIINARGSTLERLADSTLLVGTGPEIAVVSTKAYSAQLATLYQLAYAVGSKYNKAQKNIKETKHAFKTWYTSEIQEQIHRVADKLINSHSIFVIGKHDLYPIAKECALKIKEASYLHAESFAAGELKHGVIALIEKGTPCIVLYQNDHVLQEVLSSASELQARDGYIIGIGPKTNFIFDVHIETFDIGDVSLFSHVVIAHLLGYYTAIQRNLDPDKPRNLAKSVTVK